MTVSCTVFEIKRDIGRKTPIFHTHCIYSIQLNFIKNCSLKAGLNEQRTDQNYKNTKLHIARLNRETNERKQKKKHSGQV